MEVKMEPYYGQLQIRLIVICQLSLQPLKSLVVL